MRSVRAAAPDRPMPKAQIEALAAFRYCLRRVLRSSEQLTRAHGMTPLQYQLLLQVKGFPGRSFATVGELAERLQAKHHGVVALVSRCESASWVKRRVSALDRRRVEVSLTKKGEAQLDRVARLHRSELASLQGALDASMASLTRAA